MVIDDSCGECEIEIHPDPAVAGGLVVIGIISCEVNANKTVEVELSTGGEDPHLVDAEFDSDGDAVISFRVPDWGSMTVRCPGCLEYAFAVV